MARKFKRKTVRKSGGFGGLPKELTTVTPLSRFLAMVCFITVPVIAFFYGMRIQRENPTVDYQPTTVNYQLKKHVVSPTPILKTPSTSVLPK